MKLLILICVTIILGLSSARRYSALEEKQNNKRFLIIPDNNGNLHIEDLQKQTLGPNVTLDDFNIYYYSPEPTVEIKLSPHDFDGTIPSNDFDPSKKSIFLSHGWSTAYNTSFTSYGVKKEVLQNGGANFFLIDWSRVSHEFYTVAAMGVQDLGKICGEFMDKMLEKYNIDSKQIMLIGESMGAHVVGACGSAMKNKPGTILGLDPAQPLFFVDEPENRLGSEDGEVVHVMHSNSGFLGFVSSIGHADYYPNGGGITQPGCGPDIFGMCAHARAPAYFEESINNGGFQSYNCDSYEDFKSGLCDQNSISFFGGFNLDAKASGDYYLYTNSESPYSLN